MDALIRGSKGSSSSLLAHYRRGSLSVPPLLLWAQRKMTRCICSTAALPTHHRANSAMTTTNDDDHKHFLATTDSFPPLFANSRIPNCGTGRIQFATPCAAVFLGLPSLMLLQQRAMERACLPQTQWTPLHYPTPLSHQKRKKLDTQLYYKLRKLLDLKNR